MSSRKPSLGRVNTRYFSSVIVFAITVLFVALLIPVVTSLSKKLLIFGASWLGVLTLYCSKRGVFDPEND